MKRAAGRRAPPKWCAQHVLYLLLLVTFCGGAVAAPLRVMTTIKPLQLIALAVGGDAVAADALLAPQFSPHDYQLRPSDRIRLEDADIIFWVGPRLEAFLRPVLGALGGRATIVALQDADADPHVWLDPIAAIAIAQRMAAVFAQKMPARAAYFDANAARLAAELRRQDADHRAQLRQLPALRGYMVSHDAFSRFERRYGLAHAAALTDAADMPPSAKSLLRIDAKLADGGITCVWRLPQEDRLLRRVLDGRDVRTVTIDTMAAQVPADADGAQLFYRRLWEAAVSCLEK